MRILKDFSDTNEAKSNMSNGAHFTLKSINNLYKVKGEEVGRAQPWAQRLSAAGRNSGLAGLSGQTVAPCLVRSGG